MASAYDIDDELIQNVTAYFSDPFFDPFLGLLPYLTANPYSTINAVSTVTKQTEAKRFFQATRTGSEEETRRFTQTCFRA